MNLEAIKVVGASVGSGLSLVGLSLADAIPDTTKGWWEGSFAVAFIGFLIYAVKALAGELRRTQDLRDADRKAMEEAYSKQHDENIAARDRLSVALSDLSSSVKTLEKK